MSDSAYASCASRESPRASITHTSSRRSRRASIGVSSFSRWCMSTASIFASCCGGKGGSSLSARSLIAQVADPLDAAHAAGLVHRERCCLVARRRRSRCGVRARRRGLRVAASPGARRGAGRRWQPGERRGRGRRARARDRTPFFRRRSVRGSRVLAADEHELDVGEAGLSASVVEHQGQQSVHLGFVTPLVTWPHGRRSGPMGAARRGSTGGRSSRRCWCSRLLYF